MERVLGQLRRFFYVFKYYLFNDSNAFLYLIKEEALAYLRQCKDLGIGNIEEVEDLIFHVNSYIEIPNVLKGTLFLDVTESGDPGSLSYPLYIAEIEKERAVERDCICELLKTLPIGFRL